ncbi:hypothetical protein CVT26_007082 [Gymnopilus dilepis]|uniref:Uncharacterized protein n=1 Tax=Gymnopilus dilepis TaxID=231916 RepID=A0A409X0N6_9AGAR|nr:hypothetical protein CVT26_007082 [Gymnopilus dilepis]
MYVIQAPGLPSKKTQLTLVREVCTKVGDYLTQFWNIVKDKIKASLVKDSDHANIADLADSLKGKFPIQLTIQHYIHFVFLVHCCCAHCACCFSLICQHWAVSKFSDVSKSEFCIIVNCTMDSIALEGKTLSDLSFAEGQICHLEGLKAVGLASIWEMRLSLHKIIELLYR